MPVNVVWRDFNKCVRDLGLQVGTEIFWVSRRQMADLSPVFKSMLYGEFQESQKEIVPLPDKEPGDILEMLRCLFPTILQGVKPVDDKNVDLLLQLADEYQIKSLLEKCSAFLERKCGGNLSIGEIVHVISVANNYHMKGAVRVGLRKLSTFDPSSLHVDQCFNALPLNMQLGTSTIALFRATRPPVVHDFVHVSGYGYSHDYNKCKHCSSMACSHQSCHLHCWDFNKIPGCNSKAICNTCKMEYGSPATEFVCKCVDQLIKTQLEKYGL